MTRVAVFGDIGGHGDVFFAALAALGVDVSAGAVPEDLHIVQVGDLINRGPTSEAIVRFVTRAMTLHPDRWTQLVGNHEGLHLPDAPKFHWNDALAEPEADLLRFWWAEGLMRVATSIIDADGEELLVTHAGLTTGLWSALGRPERAQQAAAALNRLPHTNPGLLWASGLMLNGGEPNWFAGPAWAESGHEVYASWLAHHADGGDVTFGQIHGHSSIVDWDNRRWRVGPDLAALAHVSPDRRHVAMPVGGQRLVGIDPGFGYSPSEFWAPLVFEHAAVAPR